MEREVRGKKGFQVESKKICFTWKAGTRSVRGTSGYHTPASCRAPGQQPSPFLHLCLHLLLLVLVLRVRLLRSLLMESQTMLLLVQWMWQWLGLLVPPEVPWLAASVSWTSLMLGLCCV